MIDPVKRRHNRQNLVAACSALRTVAAFPFFGTLLGLTREGDIIKGDDDVDLYVDARDIERSCALLRAAGFTITDEVWPNDTPHFRQATRLLDGVKTFVDIYFYENRSDSPWIIDRWNFLARTHSPEYHLCIDKDLIFPLKTRRVFGADILMPRRRAKCCRFLYGPTWRQKMSKKDGEYSIVIHENQPHFLYRDSIAYKIHLRAVARNAEIDHLNQQLVSLAAARDGVTAERDLALVERAALTDQCTQSATEREAMRIERDAVTVARDEAVAERDGMASQRDAAVAERDALAIERDSMTVQRDAAVAERDALKAERDSMAAQRDEAVSARAAITEERDQATVARDAMQRERDDAVAERDTIIGQRNRAIAERDAMAAQRDHAVAQRDHAMGERDAMAAQRDHAIAEREAAIVRRDPVPSEPGKGLGRLFKAQA